MSFPLIRQLINSGDLVLWQDFRSGHIKSLARLGNLAPSIVGAAKLRSGVGLETAIDETIAGGGVTIADDPMWTPPADGCCVIASYLLNSTRSVSGNTIKQVIGQAAVPAATLSWALRRSATQITFKTSDGTSSTAVHTAAAPLATVETVVVRYTGGVGANNVSISTLAPVVATTITTVNRIPQASALPLDIGQETATNTLQLDGTIRYVAFIRGSLTAAMLGDVAAEMENISWPTASAISEVDRIDPRCVQYSSRFGCDQFSGETAAATQNAEVGNTGWLQSDVGGGEWLMPPIPVDAATWGLRTLNKCISNSGKSLATLYYPRTRCAAVVTPELYAYGTWEFTAYRLDETQGELAIWPVSTILDGSGDGYYWSIGPTATLYYKQAGFAAVAILNTAYVHASTTWRTYRLTRDDTGLWQVYVKAITGKWLSLGAVLHNSVVTSDYMLMYVVPGDYVSLGNVTSANAFTKWRGVLNPLAPAVPEPPH